MVSLGHSKFTYRGLKFFSFFRPLIPMGPPGGADEGSSPIGARGFPPAIIRAGGPPGGALAGMLGGNRPGRSRTPPLTATVLRKGSLKEIKPEIHQLMHHIHGLMQREMLTPVL